MLRKIRENAVQAFGQDHADIWLNSSSRFLDGASPAEMCRSEEGFKRTDAFLQNFLIADDEVRRLA